MKTSRRDFIQSATGLTFRSVEDTVRDMAMELDQLPAAGNRQSGFDLEMEATMLAKWHAEQA